jgi:hypothetical protein
MQSIIQTKNIGPVLISSHVIKYFLEYFSCEDIDHSTIKIIDLVQSSEIEQLVTPIPSPGLEFWVHQSSSLVFTALPKDGYRLVSMVLKRDMSDFVFDNLSG